MATGDKIVNLDDLKAVHDFTQGQVGALKSAFNGSYVANGDYIKPNVSRGYYIHSTSGVKTSNTKYCITALFSPGANVGISVSGSTYEYRVALYGANGDISDGTGYIGMLTTGYTDQYSLIPNGTKKICISVHRKDNATMGTDEAASVQAALVFHLVTDTSLIANGMPADAKQTGHDLDMALGLYNNVELYAIEAANTTYPTGWMPGRYNNSGTVATDDTAICLRTRIGVPGGSNQRVGAKGIKVTSTFGTIEIKRYNNSELVETVRSEVRAYCPAADGDLLSVSIIGLTSPSSDYISGGSINNVHMYIMFDEPKKAGYVAAEYFTVAINATWPDGSADSSSAANVDCVLKLPVTYTPGAKPTRLIFMHHGNSGTVDATNQTWYSESNVWSNFVSAYLNAGYAVFDVNGAGPVSDENASHDYGAFSALQAAYKAYKYIVDKYNINPRIFVHGSSMGGATAYAFAKAYGGIVDAVGLFSPALLSRSAQMSDVYNYIAVNYGYEDQAAMAEDNYAHLIPANPCIEYYSDGAKTTKPFAYDWINDHETDGLDIVCRDMSAPIKIWCGTADTSVDPNYGDELAKAITAAGGLAIFRPITDGTHSAGLGGDSTVNSEAVLWFNRFN